jgi:hypothetical protein
MRFVIFGEVTLSRSLVLIHIKDQAGVWFYGITK